MGIVNQRMARRPQQWQAQQPAGITIALGVGALLLAIISRLLYERSGPIPALTLIVACLSFFSFAGWYVGKERAALVLLAATIVSNRYTVNIGGLNLKAEHIAIGIALSVVAWRLLNRQDRLRFDLIDLCLLAWLALSAVSGVVNAPRPLNSVKLAILAALVVGAYFATTRLVVDRGTFVFATYALLVCGTIAAAFGIMTHLLYPFGIDLGIQINPVTKQPTVYGSFWEGNLFGSFCAIITIFWIALRLSLRAPRQQRLAEAGILVGGLGLQVSLARGGWLAFLAGIGALVFGAIVLSFHHRGVFAIQPARWLRFGTIAAIASVLLWFNPLILIADYGPIIARSIVSAPTDITSALSGRPKVTPLPAATAVPATSSSQPKPTEPKPTPGVSGQPSQAPVVQRPSSGSAVTRAASATDTNDVTYVQRRGDIVRALKDWRIHPIIGWGPGSYGQKYITSSYTPAWLPTFTIRFLHDSGIIGLLLSHIAFMLIALRGLRALWRSTDPLLQVLLFGYIIAAVVLALAYEITDGFQLAFAWLFFGLLIAGVRLVETTERVALPMVPLRIGRIGTMEIERPQLVRPNIAAMVATGRAGVATAAAWSQQARRAMPSDFATLRAKSAIALRAQWALLLATAVGLLTTFYNLGLRGLWGDEVWTAWWSFPRIFLRARQPPDFPLHWILVTLSSKLGQDQFWVRLPSALLGTATVAVLFLVGRRLFDTRTALIGALLLAVAPYQVWQAQEARPYIGLACYSILTLYCYLVFIDRPTGRTWLAFTVALSLNLFNQFFALLPLATVLIVTTVFTLQRWFAKKGDSHADRQLTRTSERKLFGGVVGGAALGLLLALPLLLDATLFLLSPEGGPGKTGTSRSPVTLAFIQGLLGTFGAGQGWTLWLLAGFSTLGVLIAALRRRWLPLLVTITWLTLPLMALLLLKTNHTFDPKYLLFMQPIYLLLAGYGISGIIGGVGQIRRLRGNARLSIAGQPIAQILVASMLALLLAFAMIPPTAASYRVEKTNDWSAVCDYFHGHVEAGDLITGDGYYQGIMLWCFSGSLSVSLAPPNGQSPAKIAESGQNVWYIRLNQTPEAALLSANYEAIPRVEWARPGVGGQTTAEARRLPFPQGEHAVSLYYHRAAEVPNKRVFNEVKGSGTWPDYAQIGPGGDYFVPLGLAPSAPRIVRLNYFDLVGRDLEVYANEVLLEKIKIGASGGGWLNRDIALPAEVGARFTLRLHNPGKEISAFSSVEVRYAADR